MSALIWNALGSLVFGIVASVLGSALFGFIKNKRWWMILIVCIVAAVLTFLLLQLFLNPGGDIQIVEIDGQSVAAAEASSEIGYRVRVRGYSTYAGKRVYVVVKPLNDRFWYIQPPAPVVSTGPGETGWEGQAYLGEPEAGVGDGFAVHAIATSDKHLPQEKLDVEPRGCKSNVVSLTRSR